MALLTNTLLKHSRVGLDTSIFIYHVEGSSRYANSAGAALEALARGAFEGLTSVLTLMEMAVRPLQFGRPEVADEYELLLLTYPNLTVAGIDPAVARRAAELRARYRLRPADALHVATCMNHGATLFLTNDKDLRRISEIQVALLEDFVAS